MSQQPRESKSTDGNNTIPQVVSGMKPADHTERQIDDEVVKRYFSGEKAGTAAALGMIAHEHNLPGDAVRYRLRHEVRTIDDWLSAVPLSASVLDVGCGAGTWAEIFAGRYQAVVGCEQSPLMVKAARERLASLTNAQIME
jgi:SAM-dependent methyltransferase